MKNIVIVSDYAYIEGGATNVAVQTAISLSKYSDYNIYFFAGCGDACDELLKSNVKLILLHMYDLTGNPSKMNAFICGIYNKKAMREFKKVLNGLNIAETVVHIHTWTKVLSSSIFDICNKVGVRTFITIHDYFLVCPNGGCFNYPKKQICEIKPLSYKCIFCNCDSRNYIFKLWRLLRQYKQNKVISKFAKLNYIYLSDFQKKQLERRLLNLQKSYKLKNPISIINNHKINCEKNVYFLFIGRVTKEKGTDLFCEAINNTGVKGVVIGGGPLLNELKNKYPNILFTGWLSKTEMLEYFDKARALIFPSLWYEGSPLTVPEVQAYGVPCIVTKSSSAVDDVVDNINGEVVEPNVQSISMAIQRFQNDKYLSFLSNNTYELFDSTRLSDNEYIRRLLAIYKGDI